MKNAIYLILVWICGALQMLSGILSDDPIKKAIYCSTATILFVLVFLMDAVQQQKK